MIAPDTTASRPFPLVDNAAHLLGQTDMVFVNAVGTGYSQAIAPLTKRSCWGVDADAALFRDFSWATRPMAGIPAMRVVRCPGTLPDLSVERRAWQGRAVVAVDPAGSPQVPGSVPLVQAPLRDRWVPPTMRVR